MTSQQISPLALHTDIVRPEWVDYNGHMNVAYYVLIFDQATEGLLDHLKLDAVYREETNASVFVVESHVTYDREVLEGASVSITTQILGSDPKRLHVFHRMVETGSDDTVATNELMILHMDMSARRVAPFPDFAQAHLSELVKSHNCLVKPIQAGRAIAMPERR
jgi:acyl-CoA thioester hydrolase